MMRYSVRVGVLCAALLSGRVGLAQVWSQPFICPTPTPPAGCGGATSAPANDLTFNATNPNLYMAQNSSIYAVRADGSSHWTHTFSTAIQNFPSPVPLRSGQLAIFVGGVDGFLYKVDATTGNVLWSKDLRHPTGGCSTMDKIIATPTVQLKAYSLPSFTLADDVVYVITSYGCSNTKDKNRVWAFNASDGSPAWVSGGAHQFNDGALGGTFNMSFGSEGCALDYTRNLLYCGTDYPPEATTQAQWPTLWAISSVNGALAWSTNVGSVHSRPALKPRTNLLYVANFNGTLHARDAANLGASIYSVGLTTTSNITRSPWPEFRGSYSNLILVADMAGNVYAVQHSPAGGGLPASGAKLWTATPTSLGGTAASTMPVVDPVTGKVFVGLMNGTMHQLSLATGTDEASVAVDSTQLYDPSLDTDGSTSGGLSRLTVAGGLNMARYAIPWAVGSTHTSKCPVLGCCAVSMPDEGNPPCLVCVTNKPNGTVCTVDGVGDPVANACNDAFCTNGSCGPSPKPDGTICPGDGCHTGACQVGTCLLSAKADGTACDDGQACTCAPGFASGNPLTCSGTCSNPGGCDVCQGGACWGAVATSCVCTVAGDHACAPGLNCCGTAAGGCVDLQSSFLSCSDCGAQCPGGMHCASGQCAAGCLGSSCSPGVCLGNGTCCGAVVSGQTLSAGQNMATCGATCGATLNLIMQGDGNLVLYQGGTPLWASGTSGHPGAYAVMQSDGNLVIYLGPTALWSTGTNGHPGAYLSVQDDGNLVIYQSACVGANNSCWASGSHFQVNCAGRTCGTDGCGGSCGTCPAPSACVLSYSCNAGGSCVPSFAGAGTVCSASTGLCQNAATCTGSSAACPANTFVPAGTVCSMSVTDCKLDATCTGGSASCPPVQPNAPNGTACNNDNCCSGFGTCSNGVCGTGGCCQLGRACCSF